VTRTQGDWYYHQLCEVESQPLAAREKRPSHSRRNRALLFNCSPSRQAEEGVATQRIIRDRLSAAEASNYKLLPFNLRPVQVLDNPPRLATWAAWIHLAGWNHLLSQQFPDASTAGAKIVLILVRSAARWDPCQYSRCDSGWIRQRGGGSEKASGTHTAIPIQFS
jgi:hypothetical protein